MTEMVVAIVLDGCALWKRLRMFGMLAWSVSTAVACEADGMEKSMASFASGLLV